MAQEEIIFRLKVDAGDSASKVNDVDKEFDSLRQSIKDTEKEVDKLSKEFGDNSKEADAARKNLAKLNLAYEELSKAATDVNAKFEEVYGELKPLTTRLGEAEDRMYELALAGKQNTKEYQDLLETVARYRQTQIETDRIVDNAAQTFSQKLGSAIQGAASGFQLVQGASALFGEESEELEKTLLKVQAAMALADGIEGVRQALPMFSNFGNTIKTQVVGAFKSLSVAQIANATETGSLTALQKVYTLVVGTSTGALKAFKIALASTGVGLLIVGLGFLISKLMDTFKSTEEIIKINEKLLRSNERIINQIDRRRDAIDRDLEKQLAYADAYGKSEEDKYNVTKKFNGKTIEENNKEIQVRLDNVKKLKAIDLGAQASSKEQYLELVKQNKKRVVDEWAKINELKRANEDLNTNIETGQIKLNTQAKEERKKDNEDAIAKQKERIQKNKEQREKEAQERLALQRKIEDLTIANIDDANTREIMSLKLKHDRELEEMQKQYGKKKEFAELEKQLLIQQENERKALEEEQKKAKDEKAKAEIEKANNDAKALLEAEIIRAEEDFNLKQQKRIELENKDFEIQMANTELSNGQRELLKAQHEANLLNIAKDSADRQKQLDKELADAKSFLVDQTSAMFGQLASSAEQGSAIQKAFAITQVTIDTAKSISSVIAGATAAAAAGGPAAPFLIGGYIASGIATVTKAFSSVNNILKKPMPNVQPPSGNRPNENTQTTQQGTQQNIQAQSTYKVVVVDSDITKMQDKTKKVNAISTI
jgi:hypothetical protein